MQTRRAFVTACGALAAPAQRRQDFFRVAQRGGRWVFVTPEGDPFFSVAMNHIDSATMRYPENLSLWQTRFGNSERKWIESVGANLREWGFNSVGWVQEVVVRGPGMVRHSRNYTLEQYQWLNMPYCHMLPFAEFHQWEVETRFPDFFSKEFEDWCDYVARDHCTRMAGERNLIGYFYIDCPVWVHSGQAKWRGPVFDPKKLASQAGRDELSAIAKRYYQVTHNAIRRYDRNHLILGDRYEARQLIAEEVLHAAMPYVDVMSFQYFSTPPEARAKMEEFFQLTRKPVLLADASVVPGARNKPKSEWSPAYAGMLRALREVPGCVGWHICGAYVTNRTRGFGFLDESARPDEAFLRTVKTANQEVTAWAAGLR